MPVGFNSPARNLFLLGSTGAQLVTNFFKTIDRTAGTDGVYLPDEIKFNIPDQKYILAGTASNSQSKDFGWFEKRSEGGTADWQVKIQSTLNINVDTTLRALEIDNNDNLIVVGKTGDLPWVAKYTNGGSISWQVASDNFSTEYSGIAIDSNNNIYACGSTPTASNEAWGFIEKFDTSGNPGWSQAGIFSGRDIILTKCAVNSREEVVAVGIIEDDSSYKGYIVKVNANTGEVLWDRSIRSFKSDVTLGYEGVFCEDVYIDGNDQIYVVGRLYGTSEVRSFLIKYTPEGNMIWQKETPPGQTIEHYFVRSDTETEQTVVYSQYFGLGGMLSKYSKNGDLVFRRLIYSSFNSSTAFGPKGLDADASNYYLLFVDDPVDLLAGDPKRYTFGKVSSSGNGLGNFTYSEGTGQTIYYQSSTIQDIVGRLSDGSVRQDTSDLISYPFGANKLMFDDLATQVANKKRQLDAAGIFDYSLVSPLTIVRPYISKDNIVYGNNLLLNYDFANKASYSGTGSFVNNLSSVAYPGSIAGATFNSAGYFNFDGTNDYIEHATNSFPLTGNIEATLECWIYYTTTFSGATTEAIISYGNGPSTGDTIALGLFDDHRLGMFFNGGTNIGTLAGALTSYKNTWCHVVGTKSQGSTGSPGGTQTIALYVNGVQLTLGTWASPITPNVSSRVIRLGRWTNDAAPLYFNGRMGEARIYNRVLTAIEVSVNFNATRSKYGV